MDTLSIVDTVNESEKELARRAPRVLVVEDDTTFEVIWEHIIRQADKSATMEWARSFSEAEQKIRQATEAHRPFDLVISDIFLAGPLTGIELWEKYHRLFNEKFILVSSAEQVRIHRYFLAAGDPIYLQKPLSISESIETVYSVLCG